MDFRVARHTKDLKKMISFYCEILNFEILGDFENHSNYSGVFIGQKKNSWHLEFTETTDEAIHTFDEDDLLIFYSKTAHEHNIILKNIAKNQIIIHQAKNPYWKNNGLLLKDPDGYNVMISDLKIKLQ